jgi:hypothetical protein
MIARRFHYVAYANNGHKEEPYTTAVRRQVQTRRYQLGFKELIELYIYFRKEGSDSVISTGCITKWSINLRKTLML